MKTKTMKTKLTQRPVPDTVQESAANFSAAKIGYGKEGVLS